MKIKCVWEHNGEDTILYANNFIGAFTRGETNEIALQKMRKEVKSYLRWKEEEISDDLEVSVEQEKEPLTMEEYLELRELALKSARDFLKLYESIPDKHSSNIPAKITFLGPKPRTAFEMYEHTKEVNSYYFGEIGVPAGHDGTIYDCRKRGFELLEAQENFRRRIG